MEKKLILPDGYPFAYETHLHTSETSACASSTGAEMAEALFRAGYAGLVVTDHFYTGNTAVDKSLPWHDWVDGHCRGYESAKKRGDELGINVMFGWESAYRGMEFLIYGPDREWLYSHPEIKEATPEEQYALIHEAGGIVIHAHPYREEFYIPEIVQYPDFTDAVETNNTSHERQNTYEFNERALAYALRHDFPQTCGSDIHSVNLYGGGMAFSHPVSDIREMIAAIMNREGKFLTTASMREI